MPRVGVLVNPGERVDLDLYARFLQDLTADAGLRGLGEFEDSARELPNAFVRSADRQESAVLAQHGPGHGHGMQHELAQRVGDQPVPVGAGVLLDQCGTGGAVPHPGHQLPRARPG